ncbi:hypothetical protein LEN26_020151 [Aphanomyces euteiches]|nr:hypothetical protein LEN26_020151 [Aphanomyces euteiches]KAH9128624.1 hypothetical protein AeMF1_001242 [Aphanomyces euteiches]KAH9191488.1 hypothetical protein AeNC1_006531 [Aphanomyces euteiches]
MLRCRNVYFWQRHVFVTVGGGGGIAMESSVVPFMLLWASYIYMPIAVMIYLYFRDLPTIKHRMPTGTACAGILASIYCLVQPPCILYSEQVACGSVLLVLVTTGNTAVFVLVWTAFTVLVLYGITEIIARPTHVSHDRVAVWNYFRGMIIPGIQVPAGICVCVVWNLPHIILLVLNAPTISQLTYAQCSSLAFFDVITYIAIGQVTVVLAAFLFVAYQLRYTMDTFLVRSSYEYTSVYMLVCSCLCLTNWAVSHYTTALSQYHLSEMLTTQALQGIVFFNILLPLISAYKERHKIQDLTGSTSLQVNWDSYLQNSENYMSYMEFCHGQTAILLAWKACADFREGESKLDAFELYQQHIAPDGTFSVYPLLPESIRRKYSKMIHRLKKNASLVMINGSKVVPQVEEVDVEFFEPLRQELVRIMVTTDLAKYEQDELGKDWMVFHTRRRSIHSLEYVQKVATKSDLLHDVAPVKAVKVPPWNSIPHSSETHPEQDELHGVPAPESPSHRTNSRKFATDGPQRHEHAGVDDNQLDAPPGQLQTQQRSKSHLDAAIVDSEPTLSRNILLDQ